MLVYHVSILLGELSVNILKENKLGGVTTHNFKTVYMKF
jgi:hypothetical protein